MTKLQIMKLKKINFSYLIATFITVYCLIIATPTMASKSVYGYLEPVTLLSSDEVTLTAKLDTGAETASISAQNIQLYKKEGKEYVTFIVAHPEMDEKLHYDLPIVRHSRIKRRASEGHKTTSQSRPVVNLQIYFDGQPHNIMVNLIDRSHFSTPMLLGRKALKKVGAIVDSTVKYTLFDNYQELSDKNYQISP